ncbi:AAA family ATPase [Nonomuraea sp. NPDC000554]|uniref:AAA family ATPase n=1 Tax=Nonomuraea sp. NPDC000554 TaxID=3154259 RepID=UPI00331B7F98
MIRFHDLVVRNFALYPDAHLHFSTDEQHPLTVIRGENECGKTTLMRAFLWVLYGEQGLPEIKGVLHPIRPVWADEESVRTSVELRFEARSSKGSSNYKLIRRATTSARNGRVSYFDEEVKLYYRNVGDGSWDSADSQMLDLLMRRFFRPELRDFFFIDADKAVQFVGGPEGAHDDSVMRTMTTQAINNLLGLDSLHRSIERLEQRQSVFVRQAGRDSGNTDQVKLAARLEELQQQKDRANLELKSLQEKHLTIEKDLNDYEAKRQKDILHITEASGINEQVRKAQDRLSLEQERRASLIGSLSSLVDSDSRLSTFLMLPAIESVIATLEPMQRQGLIPPTELTLLPRLIREGKCVCGISFDEHPERKHAVQKRLRDSEGYLESAQFLDEVLNCAQRLGNQAVGRGGRPWTEDVDECLSRLGEVDRDMSDIISELDILKVKASEIAQGLDAAAYAERERHSAELRRLHTASAERLLLTENIVKETAAELRSVSEKLRVLQTGEKRSRDLRDKAEVSEDLQIILTTALHAVESEQVHELSRAMNRIFRNVIGATEESNFSEVGVQGIPSVIGSKMTYELFAKDGKRNKPLAMANGASRRALAVSFVLALAETTASSVPFVADSLLHAFSGGVLRRMVSYLVDGQRVGQPIIFGHTHDLLDDDIRDVLRTAAGRTYTVTSQSHVGGDVVRAAPNRQNARQTVVCDCGINEYCDICEHVTYAGDSRFVRRSERSRID